MEFHSTELHSMKLHSINYCFTARINISNTSIALFYVPMKINKNTMNAYT